VSRFDRLKHPVGVIQAYRLARRTVDCQLVLAGGGATNDPEGAAALEEVRRAAHGAPLIHVLALPPFSDRETNALQRASAVGGTPLQWDGRQTVWRGSGTAARRH
jgi:trehalose synthase